MIQIKIRTESHWAKGMVQVGWNFLNIKQDNHRTFPKDPAFPKDLSGSYPFFGEARYLLLPLVEEGERDR